MSTSHDFHKKKKVFFRHKTHRAALTWPKKPVFPMAAGKK